MRCDDCGVKFNPSKKPGGLFFSPPKKGKRKCKKYHLCKECAEQWVDFLKMQIADRRRYGS